MVSYKSSQKNINPGGLAQLGERLPCKQEVTSSTLVFSTWQRKLLKIKYSSLAQSVEHSAVNRSVVGSSPTGGAHKARKFNVYGFYFILKYAPWGQKRLSA